MKDFDVDVNERDADGRTPLHYAVAEIVRCSGVRMRQQRYCAGTVVRRRYCRLFVELDGG